MEVRRRLPGLGGGEPGAGAPRSRSAWAIAPAESGIAEGEQVAEAPETAPAGEVVEQPSAPTPEELVARIDAARVRLQATIKAPADEGDDTGATADASSSD